jgi:enoyl-CoA hydratase/carnithine racemase
MAKSMRATIAVGLRSVQEGNAMTEPTGFIRLDREGSIGIITLARPNRRNALNARMYTEIAQALRDCDADPAIRALVIRGEGRDYCAGNDINDFQQFGKVVEKTGIDPRTVVNRERAGSVDLVYVLMELRKPIVAAVQGNAVGFGATMLLLVDFVIVEPSAVFRYPFVDLAMVPEAGSSQLLKERVGYAKAAEILMITGKVGAEEAVRMGLANELVGTDSAFTRAMEYAATLTTKPPISLIETKALLRRDTEFLADRVNYEFERIAERTTSAEAQEIFAKFLTRT